MQEDLEAEFQSLFSLLEELKEGMLMKIKQDRASRTYELQVCVIWGGAGGGGVLPDPLPDAIPCTFPRARPASTSSSEPAPPLLSLPRGAASVPGVPSQTIQWCQPHLLFSLGSSQPPPWP